MTPSRRLYAQQTYGRAADVFETVAWRAPTATRFDPRPANDPPEVEPTLSELAADMPAWVTIAVGGVVAAVMGMLLGGAMQI